MNGRSSTETSVPKLRARIRQATSEAILAAAEEVFAEQGLETAHMGDIAARAGVAVGTLYNHFKDRDDLLAGLCAVRRAEKLEQLDAILAANHGFVPSLRALLGAFFDKYDQHRNFYRILFSGELAAGGENALRKPSEMMREIYARLDKLMKRGVREKVLRGDLVEFYSAMLMGMTRSVIIHDLISDGKSPRMSADQLMSFFLQGGGQ